MRLANHQFYYLNGKIKDSSTYDANLLHSGMSIYEVIRIIDGKTLFYNEHYQRLIESARLLNLKIWVSKSEIFHTIKDLAKLNKITHGNIELIFHIENKAKTFLCLFIENRYPSIEMYAKGISTYLYFAEREIPNIKKINLALREKTTSEIKSKDLFELLLVNKDHFITEGTRSNIFLLKNDTVFTTLIQDVLPGITRSKIIQICKDSKIAFAERSIHMEELADFDAAFYTGTSPKVIPISNIEDISYNVNHPLLRKIMKSYDQMIEMHLS